MLKAFSASNDDVVASSISVANFCTDASDSPSFVRIADAESSKDFSTSPLPEARACSATSVSPVEQLIAFSPMMYSLPRLEIEPASMALLPPLAQFARDLAIVGLMLLQGLRSAEVLALNRDDALLSEAQLRVRGKGNKFRFLPLAPETVQLLEHYLRLERPNPCSAALFVSLKGRLRGARMTPAGLRSLFRYHRQTTSIPLANPHRFRHTFASDMIRAGMSLPALMQLMGHADIQTTLLYVQVTPQDVYLQYARAVAQHVRPLPSTSS